MSARLARRGFTCPKTVIEGAGGFNETVMRGSLDFDKLTDFSPPFYTMDTGFKPICAVGAVHGHLNATLELVRNNEIRYQDIERVRIIAGTRPIQHTGDPAKKYPTNKETADHSSYYLTAIAILDRTVGPEQYHHHKYTDPRVRQLIEKISLEIDPEMDRLPRSGCSEITTKDGKRYFSRVDYPKGDPKNPMTDQELKDKFASLASKFMSKQQIKTVIDTIFRLENVDFIGDLMEEMVFSK